MNENLISSLKLLYKPLVFYYGEWNLLDGLDRISLVTKGKNLYQSFLERYYYMPLKVIFKDDELVKTFQMGICSRIGKDGRNLYFSKKEFLRNIISNVDDLVSQGGDKVYKEIKKAIREKKDMYRDVIANGEDSPSYEEVKNEYLSCQLDISLDEFILLCKKKYTRLLTGYNAVLNFFDKPILLDRFIQCFSVNQLYLFTVYSVLKQIDKNYESYGKVDTYISYLDSYCHLVSEIREKDSFYTSSIEIEKEGEKLIYTIDSFLKEYDEFLLKVNG